MSLKSLMERLKNRAADTPDTLERTMRYQCKAPIHAGCTLDTPDTPDLNDTRFIELIRQFAEAVNNPANSERDDLENQTKPDIAAAVNDPDRWCWPHSTAMTGQEIDTFAERTGQFNRRGLAALEAELLADKLVTRDRESDDRRLCLECVHLEGHAPGSWGCGNWRRAGVATKARDAQLSAALVNQPQRCGGFAQLQQKE